MKLSIKTRNWITCLVTLFTLGMYVYLIFLAEYNSLQHKWGTLLGVVFLLVPLICFVWDILKNNGVLSFERLTHIFLWLMILKFLKIVSLSGGVSEDFTYLITRLDIATDPFVIMYLLFFPTFLENSKENNNA